MNIQLYRRGEVDVAVYRSCCSFNSYTGLCLNQHHRRRSNNDDDKMTMDNDDVIVTERCFFFCVLCGRFLAHEKRSGKMMIMWRTFFGDLLPEFLFCAIKSCVVCGCGCDDIVCVSRGFLSI